MMLETNYSCENQLLLLCIQKRVKPEIIADIRFLLNTDIDWDYLIHKAYKHKVLVILYWQIQHISPDLVPPKIIETMKNHFHENAHKNLLFTSELIKVLNLLESNHINAIAYKGPVLAILAYNNVSLREFVDLDIFIEKKDALKVKNLLTSHGFELFSQSKNIKDSFYLKTQREYVFWTGKGVSLEVHWKFQGMFFKFPVETDFIFDRVISLDVGGKQISSFSIEVQLLILCIHAALHDWCYLSMVSDVFELVQSHPVDWVYLIEKSEQMQVKRILGVNLILARDLLGLEIPNDVQERFCSDFVAIELSRQIVEMFFLDKSLSMYRRFILTFKKRDNLKDGINDFLGTIFSPTFFDFRDFALPSHLYFLYYILRPFFLLKRYWNG